MLTEALLHQCLPDNRVRCNLCVDCCVIVDGRRCICSGAKWKRLCSWTRSRRQIRGAYRWPLTDAVCSLAWDRAVVTQSRRGLTFA
jgi:hypothetical protein